MSPPINQKEELFRDIRDAVDIVGEGTGGPDAVETDEPQVVDNIGSPLLLLSRWSEVFILIALAESLCMNCHEQGTTRLLLTRIPFFREVVLMSFHCPHCFFKNSEIQSAGVIQERGCLYTLRINSKEDLDRQIVKSETCISRFEELELEIPAQRGQLTNIEGLLSTVLEDLVADQPARKSLQPEAFEKIEEFIQKGRDMLEGKSFPFTLKIDDPAGNSWIEPKLGDPRGKWTRTEYERTPEQNEQLALTDTSGNNAPAEQRAEVVDDEIRPDEVHTFPATCPSCTRPCNTNMKLVDIPHFKEVIIMSTVCEDCGCELPIAVAQKCFKADRM